MVDQAYVEELERTNAMLYERLNTPICTIRRGRTEYNQELLTDYTDYWVGRRLLAQLKHLTNTGATIIIFPEAGRGIRCTSFEEAEEVLRESITGDASNVVII